MLFLRLLLFVVSFGFLGMAVAIVLYDIYLAFELNRLLRLGERRPADVAASQVAGTQTADAPLSTEAAGTPSAGGPPLGAVGTGATVAAAASRPGFHLRPRSAGIAAGYTLARCREIRRVCCAVQPSWQEHPGGAGRLRGGAG